MENNFHRQPRSGWNSRENELLAQQVRQAKGARLPLRTAFEAVARATGRCPNSVRNHYYAALHARQNGVPAFIPFSEEEGAALVREILLSCTAGESVRSCTMRLAEGDTRRMLRYQNKYRSLLKSRPEFIRQIRREILAGGQPVFDPYALPRQGPGRPRKQEKEEGLRPLLLELCRRLAQLTEATEQKDLC